jgi:hypothetical protein
MDYTTCYCRSPQCPMYGQVTPRAHVKMHDWQRQGPRFRCARCGGIVSHHGHCLCGDTHRPHHLPARRDGAGRRVEYPSDRTPIGSRQRYRQSLAAHAGSTLSKRDELLLPPLASARVPIGRVVDVGVPVAGVQKTTIRTFTVEGEEKNEGLRPHIRWTKIPDFIHGYRGISPMNRVFFPTSTACLLRLTQARRVSQRDQ